MFVEKITFIDSKGLFEIIIDKEIFLISYEKYNELNIKNQMQIDIELYEAVKDESIYQELKKIADVYINYKRRTTQEVRNKLYKSSRNTSSIEKVINYFKKLNVLDDEKYAKDYIDYSIYIKRNSINYTKNKLYEKGIQSNISNIYLREIDDDVEYQNAIYVFKKKYKDKDISDINVKNKITRYLSYKGYTYDIINKILREFK